MKKAYWVGIINVKDQEEYKKYIEKDGALERTTHGIVADGNNIGGIWAFGAAQI